MSSQNDSAVRRSVAAVATVALALLNASCTEQLPKERATVSPVPTATTIPTTNPAVPGRTVQNRSPFGELRSDNLFLDGDFEFTGRNGQMPWLVFKSSGQGTIGFDTGGKCASGIRCALMKKDDEMIGFVASAPEGANRNITFSVLAKTSTGVCADVKLDVTDLLSGSGGGNIKPPDAPSEEDGWCHFEGVLKGAPTGELVLYVTAKADQVWLDHAVAVSPAVKPMPSAIAHTASIAPDLLPLTAETRARVRTLGVHIRGSRIYGDHASLVREGKIVDEKRPAKFPN